MQHAARDRRVDRSSTFFGSFDEIREKWIEELRYLGMSWPKEQQEKGLPCTAASPGDLNQSQFASELTIGTDQQCAVSPPLTSLNMEVCRGRGC
jgi:hypothetical protein